MDGVTKNPNPNFEFFVLIVVVGLYANSFKYSSVELASIFCFAANFSAAVILAAVSSNGAFLISDLAGKSAAVSGISINTFVFVTLLLVFLQLMNLMGTSFFYLLHGVPMDKKIPAKAIAKAENSKDPKVRKQAVLAETLSKLRKKK